MSDSGRHPKRCCSISNLTKSGRTLFLPKPEKQDDQADSISGQDGKHQATGYIAIETWKC